MTVPEPHDTHLVYQMGCRTTLGALVQLLSEAQSRIIISAPFIRTSKDNGSGIIIDSIKAALQRGVYVDFLSTKASIRNIKQDDLTQQTYNRLRLYQTSENLSNEQMLGSHAKFCIADGKSAYIGSANLTSPGLVSQLELGLLVQRGIAHQIEQFWDYLIDNGHIIQEK